MKKGIWNLFRINLDGTKTAVGTYHDNDGCDAMGCDMDAWMRENGHYGAADPEQYDWEGDTEHVAIMSRVYGMPEFSFYFLPAGEEIECVCHDGPPVPGRAMICGEEGALTEFQPTFDRPGYDSSFPCTEGCLEPLDEANHGAIIDLYDELTAGEEDDDE